MTALLEIAVTSATAAALALAHGADRVELCTALELDGLTPSQAMVEASVATGVAVNVLVRSRPGAFSYDRDELALMAREAELIAAQGAAGVVIGALTPAGELDLPAIARLAAAARAVRPEIDVTVHRAIDAARDPVASVGALAASGIAPTRVLTSGGAGSAPQGAATIARMVGEAGRIQIMAGGGVSPETIPLLLRTGAAAVHLSAKRVSADGITVDPEIVARSRAAVDASRTG